MERIAVVNVVIFVVLLLVREARKDSREAPRIFPPFA